MLPNGKLHPSVRHIAGTALFQYEVLHDGQIVVALTFNDSAMVLVHSNGTSEIVKLTIFCEVQ